MSLTKEARDALPDSDFAVPETRDLPIHDERHVRMGWSQVDRTKGLTDEQRKSAKARILRRAHKLGMDTADWQVQAVSFRLAAMSLAVPEVDGHPNRMPFTGILTRIDEPSDEPPGGSTGKRVFIPKDVAEQALPSLLGMAVDYTENFDGHDKRSKIGVITAANVVGNAVEIAGFLYASDFPEECARIQAEKNQLGFSYECQVAISDMDADPWVVTLMFFTGAAVLYKHLAAYRTTSLAAQAEETVMNEELKKILEAITGLNTTVTTLSASVATVTKDMADLKAGKGASLAGPIVDQVKPHVDACNAVAAAMEKDGIGAHPTKGHASAIRHVAAHLAAAAVSGHLPHIYRDHDYLSDARVEAGAEAKIEAANKATMDELKKVTDALAAVGTQVKDLQAKAFDKSAEPARRTLSPEITSLLSKHNLSAAAESGELTVDLVDKTLDAAPHLTRVQRIETKLKLRAAGLLPAGKA